MVLLVLDEAGCGEMGGMERGCRLDGGSCLAMGKMDDEDGVDRCCPDGIDGEDCRRAGARSSTDSDDSRTELMGGQFTAGGRRVDGEMGFNPSEFGRSCWPGSDRMDLGH
ncbi:hypothetical protein ACLOJK_026969 [Asimina triloba]